AQGIRILRQKFKGFIQISPLDRACGEASTHKSARS
ncbi:MAG: hypothetical protein ACI90Z_001362, partial [Cyanobium sp.]